MKALLSVIIAYLLFFNCSSDVDVQTAEMQTPLTDVLTLELSFGAEEERLKSEFLLAIPYGIAGNDDGDIFVTDENKVKIFNADGEEKMILGGEGQGPGEFIAVHNPFTSPTGFLTVNFGYDGNSFNIYSPDYKFVKKLNFRNLPSNSEIKKRYSYSGIVFLYSQFFLTKFVSINEEERVYTANAWKRKSDNTRQMFDILVYDKPDTTLLLAEYTATRISSSFGGELLFVVLPDRRILYTHTGHDRIIESDKSTYILHVFSMDNYTTSNIRNTYTPVEIPKSQMEGWEEFLEEMRIENFFKENKYYASLQKLLIDEYTLFALTNKNNEKDEILTDVFDLQTGTYLKSIYLPSCFNYRFEEIVIKKGYAYVINKNEEGFNVIEKYKIDPAVYGK